MSLLMLRNMKKCSMIITNRTLHMVVYGSCSRDRFHLEQLLLVVFCLLYFQRGRPHGPAHLTLLGILPNPDIRHDLPLHARSPWTQCKTQYKWAGTCLHPACVYSGVIRATYMFFLSEFKDCSSVSKPW